MYLKPESTVKKSFTVPPHVEKETPESTDREDVSTPSTCLCPTVELGPETMKALKDMIETAIRELVNVKVQAPVTIRPEVIQAAKDGDRYRAMTQEKLGRGW